MPRTSFTTLATSAVSAETNRRGPTMTTTTTNTSTRLRALAEGQRVKVVISNEIVINALGTVDRVRRDGGAWVTLDKRSVEGVHPFDADDETRATNVLAYPEDCEPATTGRAAGTRSERRRNKMIAQEAKVVTLDMFGKDHWSTFGYLTTIAIDGHPDRRKMRCDPKRHPLLANEASQHFP